MKTKIIRIFTAVSIIYFTCICLCHSNEGDVKEVKIISNEAVICQEVVDREPIGSGEIFPSDIERLYCFTRITGATADTQIIHNWYFNKELASTVNLTVKSSNWRTYSSKTIVTKQTGNWRVEILTADGKLLKQIYFLIN